MSSTRIIAIILGLLARLASLPALCILAYIGSVVVLGLVLPHAATIQFYAGAIGGAAFLILVTIGLILGWIWEGLGGAIILLGCAITVLWSLITGQISSVDPGEFFVSAYIFLVPALLFLGSWGLSRRSGKHPQVEPAAGSATPEA